jgi:tetratricopeptide (TPR) repeat protein
MAQNTNKVGAQESHVTVGINKATPRWLQRRLVVAMAAVLVVAGAAIGGVVVFTRNPAPTAKKQSASHSNTTSQQPSSQTTAVSYQASEQSLQDQLASDKDTASKVTTYSQQSVVAIQDSQYTDAQKYAENAMQADPSSPTPYADLALIAQDQHNNAQAKQYWQEAIDHLSPDMAGYNITKADYQNNLDALK